MALISRSTSARKLSTICLTSFWIWARWSSTVRRMAKLPTATRGSAVTSASIVSRAGIPKLWRRRNIFMKDPRASSEHYAIAIVKKASGRARSDLGDLRPQERGHALPSLVGAGDIVGRAALVGEGMRRVVTVDLVFDAGGFQSLFEIVDRGGGAPVVLVGEVPLKRHLHLGRVGELLGRDAVKADRGVDLRDMHRRGDRQRSAHAEPHHRDLAALPPKVLGGTSEVLVRRRREVETGHQMVGLVGLGRQAAFVKIGGQRIVAGASEPVGHPANLVVEAPPLLDHDHARQSLP